MLQAEENEIPNREPAGLLPKGKIQQYINKVTDQEDKSKTLVKRYMFALFKTCPGVSIYLFNNVYVFISGSSYNIAFFPVYTHNLERKKIQLFIYLHKCIIIVYLIKHLITNVYTCKHLRRGRSLQKL